MKSILDPTFRYTPSVSTDLAKTFARIRREQAKARELHVVPNSGHHAIFRERNARVKP